VRVSSLRAEVKAMRLASSQRWKKGERDPIAVMEEKAKEKENRTASSSDEDDEGEEE
jgi:hypothetical protein